MSKRLGDIPDTCPIYDEIKSRISEIKNILGEQVSILIDYELTKILKCADQIRNTCADLRETASDIADSKNEEIEEIRKDMQWEIDENVRICVKIQDELYYANERIEELESKEVLT
jgi:hypothetical protein